MGKARTMIQKAIDTMRIFTGSAAAEEKAKTQADLKDAVKKAREAIDAKIAAREREAREAVKGGT